jgi:hypothetical protein
MNWLQCFVVSVHSDQFEFTRKCPAIRAEPARDFWLDGVLPEISKPLNKTQNPKVKKQKQGLS